MVAAGKGGGERLQKVMAQSGLGSRRALETPIAAGEVLINGSAAGLGDQVRAGDRLEYKGTRYQVIEAAGEDRTLIYNKPLGEVTTRSDPEGRRTVFDKLPRLKQGRWVSVGRLDINTTGLLLLTTDGELANRMMHPSSQVDREYACRVHGEVTEEQIEQLKRGVELEDGPARFSDIQAAREGQDNKWFYVVLLEGRNREVRRLWASQEVQVSRLKRVRYGPVFMPKGLRMGHYHELGTKEHTVLREDAGLPARHQSLVLEADRSRGRGPRQLKNTRGKRAPRGGGSDRPARSRRGKAAERSGGRSTARNNGPRGKGGA